ncbi:MAG TPA: branched-chain amino acid ABC transporter substrate-binding protein [Stellaceae bacterium]|jgi:branched-chain amino acid transport system substrate-binding protein|nr:branched-chain amino acid ABC transporter substrate-binding protein [Stellaceae bacterium]
MTTRRALITRVPAVMLAGAFASRAVFAADKTVKVGIDVSLTGAGAEDAILVKNGAMLAVDEANANGGVAGYTIEPMITDDGSATAGQFDPAQAATNARKMVADPDVVAAVGPQNSGCGKAMSPIFSQGDLATITPSSTNPDITDPKFAQQFDPSGRAVYFRVVTTDSYQGPGMANYFAQTLKVKKVYVLDDSGAYGVGIANTFEGQAKKLGIEVLGHDQLNPQEADYTTLLTKIKPLNLDAFYFGGNALTAAKLAKQAYDIVPDIIKAGGDGVYSSSLLKGAGFPAMQGWYATIAAPFLAENPSVQPWIKRYTEKYGLGPSSYAITAYDAMLVVLDGIKTVAESGKPVTRSAVRDAIQAAHTQTLQGVISFDDHGDITDRTISVFQAHEDKNFPVEQVLHQYKYLGTAPQSS